MKKFYSLILLFTILVSGCSQDEVVKEQSSSSESLIFTASFEDNESRTYLNENEHLRWNADDLVSIFAANTYNQKYQFKGETGANSGEFEPVGSSYSTGNDLSRHYAIYPYNNATVITEEGVITATLPAEQRYAEKSFGLEANTMVAVTADENDRFLKFKNVGGYLELKLYGDDVTVKSIKLQGNSDEKIAGSATITPTYNGEPIVKMADIATNTITLDCGEGVKIASTAETATTFWMVVPPTTFENGFTVTITGTDGGKCVKSTSKSFEIKRNGIESMSAFEVKYIPYVTFTADEVQIFSITYIIDGLQYSVNGSEWEQLGTGNIYFGGERGNLRLRGKTLGTVVNDHHAEIQLWIDDVPVTCTGDIRTLLDYENYLNKTRSGNFKYLFSYCDVLTSAPQLPMTELAEGCYNGMFYGCTSLVNAPELPATTLAKNCYAYMFYGCTSLVNAPELPATTLKKGCYTHMFKGCEKLNEVTMLATDISEGGLFGWLDGVSSTGTFTKAASMTTLPEGTSGIPTGWTVISK